MNRSWCDYQRRGQYRDRMATAGCFCNGIFNHTSLCQFYQGRLLLHVTLPFEEKPTSNLPGDNLRYYRQRKSLTTRQLAEQIDVVPATILMYEQNKHPIPFDVANGLADALDVNAGLPISALEQQQKLVVISGIEIDQAQGRQK